ncbi:MAG: DJ-1/PfpI family protein [Actinobacteria bacterium]|nr:DJ-1/PfpI family protein [Actinomycetota bacterium]
MTTYGLLIFDGVEELDFQGPHSAFSISARMRDDGDTVLLLAERPDPITGERGMRVLPDHTLNDHPPLDVLLVPGGDAKTEVSNPVLVDWIQRTAATVDWVTSVCVGAFLLHEAGPARDRRVATHRLYEDRLEARGQITVVRDARYVVDGNLVTSQGVTGGIDLALWLIGRLHGRDHARAVRRHLQYDPAPPYLADEPLAHVAR